MRKFDKSLLKIEEDGRIISFSSIAFSKLCEQVFVYFLAIVNSFMLSAHSPEAVSASSLSAQIINLGYTVINMIISGATIHLSIALGRSDKTRAANICSTALYASVTLAAIIGVISFLFPQKILALMNADSSIMGMTSSYLRVISLFFPIRITMSLFTSLLICNGYAPLSLTVGVVCNILNALFSFVVLFTPITLPVDKVTGVAFANSFAYLFSMILAITLFKMKKCPFGKRLHFFALKDIFRLGVPAGANSFSYTLAQTITTAFIAFLGVTIYNTKVYVANIVTFSYMVSLAVGHAGSVFTGRYNGKRNFDAIYSLYKRNVSVAVLSNVAISTVIFLLHKPLIGIFTRDAETIRLAGQIMLIDIAVEAFRAINNVSDVSLNANGDVKITLASSVLSCWLCSVLLSYVLGIKLGLGLSGVWLAFLADEALKAVLYIFRWKSQKWRYIKI